MEDVDGFFELSDVHPSINTARVLDANLFCGRTHDVERLPVSRFKRGLNLAQLKTCFPAWLLGYIVTAMRIR
jgi:hypothetical protein